MNGPLVIYSIDHHYLSCIISTLYSVGEVATFPSAPPLFFQRFFFPRLFLPAAFFSAAFFTGGFFFRGFFYQRLFFSAAFFTSDFYFRGFFTRLFLRGFFFPGFFYRLPLISCSRPYNSYIKTSCCKPSFRSELPI